LCAEGIVKDANKRFVNVAGEKREIIVKGNARTGSSQQTKKGGKGKGSFYKRGAKGEEVLRGKRRQKLQNKRASPPIKFTSLRKESHPTFWGKGRRGYEVKGV